MSEQCTQGRISMAEWKAGEDAHGFNLVTSKGELLPLCDMESGPDDDYEANARRLVACWNACEGISTEALERSDVIASMQGERRRLETQRDDLLAAMERIAGLTLSQFMGPHDMALECVNLARAARRLAKAEGTGK